MKWGIMPWFCNACGVQKNTICGDAYGSKWRVCSKECYDEITWRETLSIMGHEYHPRPTKEVQEEAQ